MQHLKVHILLFLYIGVSHAATNESYSEPLQQDTCPLITSFENVDMTCENTLKVDSKTGTRVGNGSQCWPSNGLKTAILTCFDGKWIHSKDHLSRLKRDGNCPDVHLEADSGRICKVHDYVVHPVTGFHYFLFDVPPGKCYPEGKTSLMASLSALRVGWCWGSVTVTVHYCPSLPHFHFGSKKCSGERENVYGSTCTFSCNKGYALDGPRSITCGTSTSKSVWSASAPSCKVQYCPPLDNFAAGIRECSGDKENVYGSTCKFCCHSGYILDGPQTITCGTVDSVPTWSANASSCISMRKGDQCINS